MRDRACRAGRRSSGRALLGWLALAALFGRDPLTGQEIDLSSVFYSPEGIVVVDESGEQVGVMDGAMFQSVIDPGIGSRPSDYLVVTSTSGTEVAVESITELLDVEPSQISSIPRISSAGNTTVIAVTLEERNADGVPRRLVLVGTPRT